VAEPVVRTDLPFPLVRRGKVRDVYRVAPGLLLIVATDRISAFDVVLPQGVPDKGMVLTQLTAWWLERVSDLTAHHLVAVDEAAIVERVPALRESAAGWRRRGMLVIETEPVPVECVVRGYISGSAWSEYCAAGTLAGEALPAGLRQCDRIEPPIFSPATKAATGHDENISFAAMAERVGGELADRLRQRSLAIYARGRTIAEEIGILIADTKFEFGLLPDGQILLIDEVLTPDSSRFWPIDGYAPGRTQPSFDKQPVRDYLEGLVQRGAWDRASTPPPLPAEVVAATTARYRDVFFRLTGEVPERYGGTARAQGAR
jgi:phosphoribosylaminoimidazole-succinocarboxamide synthase